MLLPRKENVSFLFQREWGLKPKPSPKAGRQVAPGLTCARPSKPHSFIVPPGLRAVELVGGVGLEKGILYLAFGMTNE